MMTATIEFNVDLDKANSLRYFLSKKEINLEEELAGYLDTLYKKYVPQSVRDFIEEEEPYSYSDQDDEQKNKSEKRGSKRGKSPGDSLPSEEK